MVKNNTIRRIKTQSGADRFDYIYKIHYHAICEKCGKVFDFIYKFDDKRLKEVIENQTGVVAKTDSITIYGICEKCKSK